MAESLAVVGVISSIIQIIDFGTRVLTRIKEYQANALENFHAFRRLSIELPVLIDDLRQIEEAIKAGTIDSQRQAAIEPVLRACGRQISCLNELLGKAVTSPQDKWTRKVQKGFQSLFLESKVEAATKILDRHIQSLANHAAVSIHGKPSQRVRCPDSNVPYIRDPDFVDCGIIAEIENKFQSGTSRIALLGLGGVGPANRVRQSCPNKWVFWLHAASEKQFEVDYCKIAEDAQINGWDQPGVDVLRVVRNWLSDEKNGNWTLIIDNADDSSLFQDPSQNHASSTSKLLGLLPTSHHGSILVTARNRDAALHIVDTYSNVIEVAPMDEAHALTLLRKKLNAKGSNSKSDEILLVTAFDFLPLAITQAAVYIYQLAPRMSVSRYLEAMDKGDDAKIRLLQKDPRAPFRNGLSNSIMWTWQKSFDYIRHNTPDAANLLSLMSLYGRRAIPATLLIGYYERIKDNFEQQSFHDDLYVLWSFSFVSIDVTGESFGIHRLVQLSTRSWLKTNNQLDRWEGNYVDAMNVGFPEPLCINWETCRSLRPHAEVITSRSLIHHADTIQLASVLFKLAAFEHEMCNYRLALEMYRITLAIRQRLLGVEHQKSIDVADNLALALGDVRSHREAEAMNRDLLRWHEQVNGLDSPGAINCTNRLVRNRRPQDRYQEAQTFIMDALARAERSLGEEHECTMLTLHNAGIICSVQGNYDDAASLHHRAWSARQKVFGGKHPLTLISLRKLARMKYRQGNLETAVRMSKQALDGQKELMGESHPQFLISLRNHALILVEQGNFAEADNLLSHAVVLQSENNLGFDHRATQFALVARAVILRQAGKFKDSEVITQRLLKAKLNELGPQSAATLSCHHELALLYMAQGDLAEAEANVHLAIRERQEVLGPTHPKTVDSIAILEEIVARRLARPTLR